MFTRNPSEMDFWSRSRWWVIWGASFHVISLVIEAWVEVDANLHTDRWLFRSRRKHNAINGVYCKCTGSCRTLWKINLGTLISLSRILAVNASGFLPDLKRRSRRSFWLRSTMAVWCGPNDTVSNVQRHGSSEEWEALYSYRFGQGRAT